MGEWAGGTDWRPDPDARPFRVTVIPVGRGADTPSPYGPQWLPDSASDLHTAWGWAYRYRDQWSAANDAIDLLADEIADLAQSRDGWRDAFWLALTALLVLGGFYAYALVRP